MFVEGRIETTHFKSAFDFMLNCYLLVSVRQTNTTSSTNGLSLITANHPISHHRQNVF